jgi:hypothetical protein
LSRTELLALGPEEASDEQIGLFFERLDLLALALILGLELLDLSAFFER